MGLFVPVMITTLPFTRLWNGELEPIHACQTVHTYCPAESPAILEILGMFSNLPGSSRGLESCSLSCCKRFAGAEVIVKV